jgi:hypothetical protein
MDIGIYTPIEGAVPIQLRDPITNEPLWDVKHKGTDKEEKLPVNVLLYGQDSAQFKQRQRVLMDRRIEAGLQRKGKPKINAEVVEEEGLRTLVAYIAGWENLEVDGKAPEFNPKNAEILVKRFGWLEEQVDEAIMDRSNFIKASSKS